MQNFINWFITSSEDPEKVSLALKAIGAFAVFFGVDSATTNEGIGYMVTIVSTAGMLVSALMALYGLGRKVINKRWSAPQ